LGIAGWPILYVLAAFDYIAGSARRRESGT